ncbi:flagellin N-terminal helical domain-containing protein [Shewanella sp.]|uniref:flagellin N-terminal helical domain-containing protein n=1 Tax=Shewanella sp. TaxID=50422 RepID=UPI0040485712
MSVINTNVKALYTQAALKVSGRDGATAMQQLSTGKRINSAKDDAAGMAIATRMTQQIRSLNQAVRNAGDAISLIQTAEGATGEITDMLQRMRELAIQAINDTNANEQRGYLDLEFQQLKQEIVRISDTTEWNGFSILNGTAGVPVGERPVYKATSESRFDSVLINPTTTRDIAGTEAGELQTLTFATATTGGAVTVGGVSLTIAASATKTAVAEAVRDALLATEDFGSTSGRAVSASAGVLSIRYGASEGNVADTSFTVATGAGSATLATSEAAVTSATEQFTLNGKFVQSGALSFSGELSADNTAYTGVVFTTARGEIITMTGNVDVSAGTITFDDAVGNNGKVISDNLVYTFKNSAGTALNITNRALSLSVDVPGSVPPMNTGDLIINGITIGASYAADDLLSPPNNASGSAIAKAAAINRQTTLTGVNAVVNSNTMTGTAQTGTSVVSGRVVINGITSPLITSVLNNTRESREAAISAINRISDKTGVVAVSSNSDTEGVRLVAADGRNIEVRFDTTNASADFAARTGLKEGVQAGTYSLESRVEAPIVITTSSTGDPTNAVIRLGDYSTNESTLSTLARAEVQAAGTPVTLAAGDLVINGIDIPGATSAGDNRTEAAALTTLTNQKGASGVAMAAAINAVSDLTGVTATANPVETVGVSTTVGTLTGLRSIFINGIEVPVDFGVASPRQTASERVAAVVAAVNPKVGATGVVATANPQGGVTLKTEDGRNLSIWIDDTSNGPTAANFGLAASDGTTEVAGVSIKSVTATNELSKAATLYGGVTFHSDEAFTIEPGSNGYGSSSSFDALGFREGTYGGVVDEAVSKMTPPNTGRLSFHVGASANQTITIDLADFGKGGPITGAITGDVDLWDSKSRVNRIDSGAAAKAVLEKLDLAMDKVNATRGTMGAVMNRLEHVIDNLMNVSMNSEASRSQIEDADYAAASTELARTQIMQQAATSVLAQANADQQNVLKLLQ